MESFSHERKKSAKIKLKLIKKISSRGPEKQATCKDEKDPTAAARRIYAIPTQREI